MEPPVLFCKNLQVNRRVADIGTVGKNPSPWRRSLDQNVISDSTLRSVFDPGRHRNTSDHEPCYGADSTKPNRLHD